MEQLSLIYNILSGNFAKENEITIEDIIFNKKNTYDLKIPLSFNEAQKMTFHRKKIKEPFSIEVLEVCDDKYTFVVSPKCRIQSTKNGGTVKVLKLDKGYELKDLEYSSESKGPSFKLGVEAGGAGVNISTDNLTKHGFKAHMGKLTHEHVVIMINAIPSGFFHKHDSAEIEVEYIKIDKQMEQTLLDQVQQLKMNRLLNHKH
jgi:hypothetical protein